MPITNFFRVGGRFETISVQHCVTLVEVVTDGNKLDQETKQTIQIMEKQEYSQA